MLVLYSVKHHLCSRLVRICWSKLPFPSLCLPPSWRIYVRRKSHRSQLRLYLYLRSPRLRWQCLNKCRFQTSKLCLLADVPAHSPNQIKTYVSFLVWSLATLIRVVFVCEFPSVLTNSNLLHWKWNGQNRRCYLVDSSAFPISERHMPSEYLLVTPKSEVMWEPDGMVPTPNSQLWNSQHLIVRKWLLLKSHAENVCQRGEASQCVFSAQCTSSADLPMQLYGVLIWYTQTTVNSFIIMADKRNSI